MSRPDPPAADQIDAEHQATDLAVESESCVARLPAPLRCVGVPPASPGRVRTLHEECRFPFASADLTLPPAGHGVLVGTNPATRGLVCWYRWAQPNYNQVILARSGAAKSYLAKLEALRWLYQGVQVLVVDLEAEYQRLADAVGGTTLRLGAPGVHLNLLELGPEPDALTRRALFTHTLIPVLLDQRLEPSVSAVLDRAVTRAPSSDPRTHQRPAPLLAPWQLPWRRIRIRSAPSWPPASPPSPPAASGGCSSSQPAPAPRATCWSSPCATWLRNSRAWGRCWPWTPSGARSATPPAAAGGWSWSTRPGP